MMTSEQTAIVRASERVQAGARWLDSIQPGWRDELRKVGEWFDIADGDHCVLGSLEHRIWQHGQTTKWENGYEVALRAFRLNFYQSGALGFIFTVKRTEREFITLQWLWKAEFSEIPGIGFAAFRRMALS